MSKARIAVNYCAKILMDIGARRAFLGSQDSREHGVIKDELHKQERSIKDRLCAMVTGEEPQKTDLEILKEVNDLALKLGAACSWVIDMPGRSVMPFIDMLFMSEDPRAQTFWNLAVVAYEQLTATEVHDAVAAYKEAHDGNDQT